MKHLLLISFDFIRKGDESVSYAMASLLSFLKHDVRFKEEYTVEHMTVNMLDKIGLAEIQRLTHERLLAHTRPVDFIALSAYLWNESILNPLILYLKTQTAFRGKIILGGYQISYSQNPQAEYPLADYFISGYAENALLSLLSGATSDKRLACSIDFTALPSPYLTGELKVEKNQKMVRFESKRGCPYQCSFCAHRDLQQNKVHAKLPEVALQELQLFQQLGVNKVNVLDPIFNYGPHYLELLQELKRMRFQPKLSLQTRFEAILNEKGSRFLDLCSSLNVTLEFGLQTALPSEGKLINRTNHIDHVLRVMQELNQRGIDYEVSIIYGLPAQTLQSFMYSVDYLLNNGCKKLAAFPLMLLKGTELYRQRSKYNYVEKVVGDYNIPVVVQSNTFSEFDWLKMKAIAEELSTKVRY